MVKTQFPFGGPFCLRVPLQRLKLFNIYVFSLLKNVFHFIMLAFKEEAYSSFKYFGKLLK